MNLKYAKILAVITDTASWPDFQLLAAAIEEQAHEQFMCVVTKEGSVYRIGS